jgi:tetratricopeptide (TPR) repeat protein
MADSAIYYLNENLNIAIELNDKERIYETNMELSSILASLGLYKEAADALSNIDRQKLNKFQLIDYYLCHRYLYSGLSFYTQDKRRGKEYQTLYEAYQDSLRNIINPESEEYLRLEETLLRQAGKGKEALAINDKRLRLTEQGISKYALVTFHRFQAYRILGDTFMQKKNLILSALTDIETLNKDNAALSNLANILYEEGDIERAYRYIRFLQENTNDYNSRLRKAGIFNRQGIIYESYQNQNDILIQKLRLLLFFIAVLVLLLLSALIFVYRSMRKQSVTNRKIKEINERLNSLNDLRKKMNEQMSVTNLDLAEANHIKEKYIGYFMGLCSGYIDKLDDYRKMVSKKLSGGQMSELVKLTRVNDLKEIERNELYSNFDKIFLHIYPDFVDEFNNLLQDDEKIVPKKGELNIELRIFAFIRLGVEDSSMIAKFLGYSVNTIYNYRAKVKNKTKIARDDFETTVKRIGTCAGNSNEAY